MGKQTIRNTLHARKVEEGLSGGIIRHQHVPTTSAVRQITARDLPSLKTLPACGSKASCSLEEFTHFSQGHRDFNGVHTHGQFSAP